MPWLLEAADFTDRRLPSVPDRPAGIHSKKAVKASSNKVANLLGTAIAIQEEDACWRRFKIEPPCRLNFEPGLMANL